MSSIFHRRGKNSKIKYYVKNSLRLIEPHFMLRPQIGDLHAVVDKRADKDYIYDRVNYYNRLREHVSLPESACLLHDFHLKGHKSAYFFDSYEYLRYFDKDERFCPLFGDITYAPDVPSIVKSRPIFGDNTNSVVLNLVKCRHFIFLNDKIPFKDKKFNIIFRGECEGKPHRLKFLSMYKNHPLCDVGDVFAYKGQDPKERANIMSPYEHLTSKFIMSLEGNDVASNLKWIMSSNSIAVTPPLHYETWFMEGRLIPDGHYIEISPDYSDLIEKTTWYAEHPDAAQKIIDNANKWVEQFKNPEREKLISLLVLEKYFNLTR